MREYHIKFWELDDIPAPFIDDIMRVEMIEGAILEDKSKGIS